MTITEIQRHYDSAVQCALILVEERARAILRRHSRLKEFVMAMGAWTFTDQNGKTVDEDLRYLAPIKDLIDEWDDYLKLTGEPMRFTARGPKITDW